MNACLRFLKEDPWDRLRKLRDGFKHTKLQMLFRGQNILGYNHYADDVVEYFVQKSVANGIDIIRIFDCLNDIRNLQTAVKAPTRRRLMYRSPCAIPWATPTLWITGSRSPKRLRRWEPIPCASRIWPDFSLPTRPRSW